MILEEIKGTIFKKVTNNTSIPNSNVSFVKKIGVSQVIYQVEEGDTLKSIALYFFNDDKEVIISRIFSDPENYKEIQKVTFAHGYKNISYDTIFPGMKLRILKEWSGRFD